jgi:hypothetical protein
VSELRGKGALSDLLATMSDARIKSLLAECPSFGSRSLLNAMADPSRSNRPREQHLRELQAFVIEREAEFARQRAALEAELAALLAERDAADDRQVA